MSEVMLSGPINGLFPAGVCGFDSDLVEDLVGNAAGVEGFPSLG